MTLPDSRGRGRAPAHRVSMSAADLRLQAETRLQDQAFPIESAPQSAMETQRLLHELQVHQIELEIQNEELQITRNAAEEAAASYTDLYDFAPIGYLTLDRKGVITQLNLAAAKLLGVERAHVGGKRLIAWVAEGVLTSFNAFLNQVFESGGQSGFELTLCIKNQMTNVHIDASVNEDGQQCRLVLIDMTTVKAHQRELEYIAHYDGLTGLPNRHLLSSEMKQAMAHCQHTGQSLAVAYLDLDNIKAVNDRYGHTVGDALLIEVAKRISAVLGKSDTLARMGGDEFVVVLSALDQPLDCLPVVEQLLKVVSAAMTLFVSDQEDPTSSELRLHISASIGVTFFPQDKVDADQLMRHADQAMYAAKQAGKNRYHLFDIAQDTAIHTRREDLIRMTEALQKKEFVLYYQPKVNMRTGQVIGAEALIRWQHPERGLLPPGAFLPTVENHRLSVDIGEWVIGSALAQLGTWRAQGLDILISVNIGALQLQQKDFTARLGEILADYPDIDPSHLRLEILETSALEDISKVSGTMRACQALGVSFALDDFGTGYSSLTYLKYLPADVLKIDQGFIRNMTQEPDDLAIVKGVVGLAEVFHRLVIAEGVETKAIGDMLLGIGCELAQGYGIARPMPAADIPAWVKCWHAGAQWTA